MSDNRRLTRREALGGVAAVFAGSALAEAQVPSSGRGAMTRTQVPTNLAPLEELVNAVEFEEMAQRKLSAAVFATIAGGDRQGFDRITFRQRLNVPTLQLDLSGDLLGQKLFSPIVIGPVADQKQFHPEGELETVRGAAAANAVMVVSSRSSVPLDQIAQAAAQAKTTIWYQVFPGADAKAQIQKAVDAGCKALFITVGVAPGAAKTAAPAAIDWAAVDQLRQGVKIPIVIKGIMTAADAKLAIAHGAQGIVVSNYGAPTGASKRTTIDVLPGIVDAVAGGAAVLVDGSFRRGSDVLKALALGARGVLVGRPAMWGLAAYGAPGVETVVEFLQSELARDMGMTGKVNLAALDRTVLRIHTK